METIASKRTPVSPLVSKTVCLSIARGDFTFQCGQSEICSRGRRLSSTLPPSLLPWSSFLSIFISAPRKFIRFEFVEDLECSNHVGWHGPFNLGFQIYLQLLYLSSVCSILCWLRWYWIWRQFWDPRLNGHGLRIVYSLSLSLSLSLPQNVMLIRRPDPMRHLENPLSLWSLVHVRICPIILSLSHS